MAGWDYIVGETGYNQPFVMIDKGTNKGFDGTGVTTVTMTILDPDLTATTPAINDISCSLDTTNPLRVLLSVNQGTPNVPQTEGSYIVQFTINIGAEVRKTFELGLRVYNG